MLVFYGLLQMLSDTSITRVEMTALKFKSTNAPGRRVLYFRS